MKDNQRKAMFSRMNAQRPTATKVSPYTEPRQTTLARAKVVSAIQKENKKAYQKANPRDTSYNGWKNYETWNVPLWIENNEPTYNKAKDFMRTYKGKTPYNDFLKSSGLRGTKTGDNVSYASPKVSRTEMNKYLRELE